MVALSNLIGNSSSGLVEAPSLKRGTINIGDRQRGRLQANSVINCEPDRSSIAASLNTLYSSKFQSDLCHVINPYGDGGASDLIVSTIKNFSLVGIVKKHFFDANKKCV
jgi:GDP/UDP-N,N'-diacetylbacillosamine 2-epimerase (hydrolysing)